MPCHIHATSVSSARRFSSLLRNRPWIRLDKLGPPQPAESVAYSITVTLEAAPDPEGPPGSHQATVDVPAECVRVPTLGVARERVRAFIAEHDLVGGNFAREAGLVCRDGMPLLRIAYDQRFVELGRVRGET